MLYEDENIENVETTAFKEAIQKQLLIEALTQQKAEVFENVVFDGTRRYYIKDLTTRDYILENTTPYQMKIYDYCIEEKAWRNLISKALELLLGKNPDRLDGICDFRCKWSKAAMIAREQKNKL